MKLKPVLVLPLLLLTLSACLYAQNWSGILNPTRAIDWSQAGVGGGIPSATWTQCGSTIAAGATAATIQSAINSCGTNQYVLLGSGTFNLSTGLLLKSNMALRGSGASLTTLVFSSGTNNCTIYADVCFQNSFVWDGGSATQPGGSNAANWTAGFAKGTTQITLTNIGSSGLSVGQYIYLDQANDTHDTGNLYVCDDSCSAQGGSAGRTIGGVNHSQVQAVKITACNPSCTSGSTFTITPGLYGSNWSSSKTPGASWSGMIQHAGVEDLTMNHSSGNSGGGAVVFASAFNCWISGVRSIATGSFRNHVWLFQSGHNTVQSSYFYGGGGSSLSYGIESRVATDDLLVNNIFQHVTAPFVLGTAQGEVVAYNFSINDYYSQATSFMNPANYTHDAGTLFNLLEGNVSAGMRSDIIHGGSGLNTLFRNRYNGWESGKTSQTEAVINQSYNRYLNVVGNVLGQSGVHTIYQNTTNQQGSGAIYEVGTGDCCDGTAIPADPLVISTLMRWGNYDTVNNAVRWQSSEVPTSANCGTPCSANYANAVPASQNLPSSFFLSSKPSWWPSAKAWPAIGPDVTGGNIANVAGHANTIPAQDCYLNVMAGPVDGSGSAMSFSASNCYSGGGSSGPPAPTGLAATVH